MREKDLEIVEKNQNQIDLEKKDDGEIFSVVCLDESQLITLFRQNGADLKKEEDVYEVEKS